MNLLLPGRFIIITGSSSNIISSSIIIGSSSIIFEHFQMQRKFQLLCIKLW